MRAIYRLRRNTIGSVKLRVMGLTRAMSAIWISKLVNGLLRLIFMWCENPRLFPSYARS